MSATCTEYAEYGIHFYPRPTETTESASTDEA